MTKLERLAEIKDKTGYEETVTAYDVAWLIQTLETELAKSEGLYRSLKYIAQRDLKYCAPEMVNWHAYDFRRESAAAILEYDKDAP